MNKMKWMSLNVLLVATVLAVGVGCEEVKTGTSRAPNIKSSGPVTDLPVLHKDEVLAKRSDRYTVKLKGGEKVQIGVIGSGKTDLDLYVYDENDNLITKDIDAKDRCYCSVTPKRTGEFRVVIKNRGKVANPYFLAIK
jgi:hypothetical protein